MTEISSVKHLKQSLVWLLVCLVGASAVGILNRDNWEKGPWVRLDWNHDQSGGTAFHRLSLPQLEPDGPNLVVTLSRYPSGCGGCPSRGWSFEVVQVAGTVPKSNDEKWTAGYFEDSKSARPVIGELLVRQDFLTFVGDLPLPLESSPAAYFRQAGSRYQFLTYQPEYEGPRDLPPEKFGYFTCMEVDGYPDRAATIYPWLQRSPELRSVQSCCQIIDWLPSILFPRVWMTVSPLMSGC